MSALIPLAGSIINTAGNIINNNQNWRRQQQLLREQNEFAVTQQRLNQQYNSPANQKALLMAAGINPNFVNGTSFAESSPVEPSQVPQVSQPSPMGLINDSSFALADLQRQSLKEDVRRKKLDNDDRQLEVNSNKEELPMPDFFNEFSVSPDGDITFAPKGNMDDGLEYPDGVTVTPPPTYNKYREDRRFNRKEKEQMFRRAEQEFRQMLQQYNFLEKMNSKQLEKIAEEIKSARNQNKLMDRSVKLAEEFGILPDDAGYTALIKMALNDPNKFDLFIETIVKAASRHTGTLLSSVIEELKSLIF